MGDLLLGRIFIVMFAFCLKASDSCAGNKQSINLRVITETFELHMAPSAHTVILYNGC
jgi:hypothetical protein